MAKNKTFMEAYVEMKRKEVEDAGDKGVVRDIVEELFDMLLATDETIRVLRDGRKYNAIH